MTSLTSDGLFTTVGSSLGFATSIGFIGIASSFGLKGSVTSCGFIGGSSGYVFRTYEPFSSISSI